MMRKLIRLVGVGAAVFVLVGMLAAEARAEKKVGVLIWTKENHYTQALSGIMEQLNKEGFGEPKTTFIIENAEGNKAKAIELAKKFAAAKVDMVIALGTFAAEAAVKEIKDAPVIFSMVYDPVDAKIVQDWKTSGNNSTGSSSKYPMSEVLKSLKELAPVKKLGVLYTPGEKSTEAQLKELLAVQSEFQIKVLPIPITAKEEVASVVSEATRAVDAFFLASGGLVGEMVPLIVDIATKAKTITVSSLEVRVEKGVLLGVCANSHQVGVLAGERAAKVLKGAKPSSLPIGMVKKPDVIVNMKTVRAGQFPIPAAFKSTVTKIIE
jgi:putative ABC transport system substrate-binding protein